MAEGFFKQNTGAKAGKAFKAKYPMYVVSVKELVRMQRLLPHHQLQRRGVLVEWTEGMRVICVSHQWLANAEPDPQGEHFQCLKRLLERFMEGKVGLDSHWLHRGFKGGSKTALDVASVPEMYVWIDYCSMPQIGPKAVAADVRAAAQAVQSIPAYFERCSMLLVLAPVCKHRDTHETCSYASWRRRGWCRMELTCSILSPENTPVVVCTGAEAKPFQIQPFDGPRLLPGHGEFSCCRLGHSLNGVRIPCDRSKVGAALDHMITARAQQLLDEGRRLDHHFWLSMRGALTSCLDVSTSLTERIPTLLGSTAGNLAEALDTKNPQEVHVGVAAARQQKEQQEQQPQQQQQQQQPREVIGLQAFREKLGWTAVDDAAAKKSGFSLALCAAVANEAQVIRDLAAQGGTDFNQRLKLMNVMHLAYMFPGTTPVMAAMAFADFSTVEALLEAGADPEKKIAGISALHVAGCRGNTGNVEGWMKRFPRWDVNRNDSVFGISPAAVNAMNGVQKQGILEILVAAGADVRLAPRWGGEATMMCLMAVSEDPDLDALKMLLDMGCNPNERFKPTRCMWKAIFKFMRNTPAAWSTRWVEEFAMMSGATPLHFAAKRGDAEFTKLLVGAGATVDARNDKGNTPLEVAKSFFGVVPALLMDALTPNPAISDRR